HAVGRIAAREIAQHRGKRDEDLVVVAAVVVAVLVLLADAADDRVRDAVEQQHLADAVAVREQLRIRIPSENRDAPCLRFVRVAEVRPRSTSIVRMSWYCGSMPSTVIAAAL